MATPPDTTRLSISGVRSRVALRVARRQGQRTTLEQKLPFLAIGTEVADENGQTGRIERVGVTLEGGVPKLILELAYDAVPLRASRPASRRDQTIGFDQRPTVPEPIRPRRIETDAAKQSRGLTVAFPLERRRSGVSTETTGWLARLLAPLRALVG